MRGVNERHISHLHIGALEGKRQMFRKTFRETKEDVIKLTGAGGGYQNGGDFWRDN